MAIFQFHMQVIKRNDGKSVVAAAAYRSASRLENQYTGTVEDYSKKKWVAYSEIMLPEHAPNGFQDRGFLWNSVEEAEKDRRARLAREVMVRMLLFPRAWLPISASTTRPLPTGSMSPSTGTASQRRMKKTWFSRIPMHTSC